jgi:hypothetical protein
MSEIIDPNTDVPVPARVRKLETDTQDLESGMKLIATKQVNLEHRIENLEAQMGRLMSHIESEVGLARTDIARIFLRLFGKEEDVYGGMLGSINKKIHRFEVWFLSIICATTILGFIFGSYYFVTAVMRKGG